MRLILYIQQVFTKRKSKSLLNIKLPLFTAIFKGKLIVIHIMKTYIKVVCPLFYFQSKNQEFKVVCPSSSL